MRQRLKLLACIAALLCLCSCSVMEHLPAALQPTAPAGASNLPDLRQLSMPDARQNPWQPAAEDSAASALQLDLWLDASQVAGGVNPYEDSLYPHRSNRYREGGFHYRYENQTGWYENLLRDLLAAAEGSRIRVLRSGNEHITDEALLASGLAADDSASALRSLRRDLLTYAIDPMPNLFSTFSAERMENSFYSLFSQKMNQMPALISSGSAPLLENPAKAEQMGAYLDSLIAAYDPKQTASILPGLLTDDFSPLMQSIASLDENRLSVITCDPLTLRRLSGTDVKGSPVAYLQQLLEARGLFDLGLSVQLYAFRLDYMGQIHTINAADLTQPLIWGRLDYIQNKNQIKGPLPMPRTLLMLVVGNPSQVDSYTAALNRKLDSDPALKGLRGPDKGQLTYSIGGETITQQPFTFAYEQTRIQRHGVEPYTNAGSTITLRQGTGALLQDKAQPTVALASDQTGTCQITVSWPVNALAGGLQLNTDQLSSLRLEGVSSLLLTGTAPNTPDHQPEEGVQSLTLRDTVYQFTYTEDVPTLPFQAAPLRLTADGTTLEAAFTCDAADLQPGYYRLLLRADITGTQLSWPDVPWIKQWSTAITNDQITSWEQMADMLTDYSRQSDNVPHHFWHAWGEKSGSTYRETVIPDCPPVFAAPRLTELFQQLKDAASIDTLPYIYFQLDVFVAPANQLPVM